MAERICPDCGQPTGRHSGATYCIECALERIKASQAKARRAAPSVIIFRDLPDGSRRGR